MRKANKRKARWFLFGALLALSLPPLSWMQEGCTGKYPPASAMVATAIPTPAYPTCTNTSTPTLISDLEDDNTQLLSNQCRTGYWYAYNDGSVGGIQTTGGVGLPLPPVATATAQPTPTTESFTMGSPGVGYNGTGTSLHAVEVSTNNGFKSYDGFGFSFLNGNGVYDAYGYNGIQFYAKNSGGNLSVNFAIIDENVYVTNSAVGPHTLALTFTSSWQLYQVSMDQLAAAANSYINSGYSATTFNDSQLVQTEWSLAAGVASDIWIDNVSFY